MIQPLGRRILVKPIEETREVSGMLINTSPQKFLKCRVIKGKEDVADNAVVLIPANVGVTSDYGLIVGLVDVLAVEE